MNNILTLTSPVTESLTSPRTDTDRIECMPVPDEQRAAFWPQQFGSIPQWI
ncbi:antirestriction protein, partial [Escherichia coli]|nr:antirestriction protein [Escherichia coli]